MGWVIDTVNITLSFPPHQENRFKKILAEIPTSQKRIGIDKWNWVLGDLRSMAIALPSSQGIFGHMQEAFYHVEGEMVTLSRGFHQALVDFLYLAEDLSKRPTRLYEILPLQPTLDGYHDASGYMCEGEVILGPMAVPRTPQPQPRATATSPETVGVHPIVRQAHFTTDVTSQLVSWGNLEGQVTNSDLDLAVRVFHHACTVKFFNIQERTMLSHTDNTAGLWYQRKGSDTPTSPPSHLICLQAIHQRLHSYVPRHDYVSGVDNSISDRLSRSQNVMYAALLAHIDASYPHDLPWRLWTPLSELLSDMYSALWCKTFLRDSLLVDLPPPMGTGQIGPSSVNKWPLTPYLYRTGIWCIS